MQANSADKSERLEIGVLTRPHGIRGELKLRLHNASSDALQHAQELILRPEHGPARQVVVETSRGAGREVIVRLAGVDTRELAEALRGATVWVERAQLPALAPGEYYLIDLIGCTLVLQGQAVGRVTALRSDPTVDTLVIQLTDGRKADLPLLDAWVGPFDAAASTLELLSDDGLIV